MYKERMWKFSTPNFTVVWYVSPCDDLDLSWDDDGSIRDGLNSGKYVAFDSEVSVFFKGRKIASEYLGQSIYENVKDFRDHFGAANKGYGSYFSDMVRQAIREARTFLKAVPTMRGVA